MLFLAIVIRPLLDSLWYWDTLDYREVFLANKLILVKGESRSHIIKFVSKYKLSFIVSLLHGVDESPKQS